MSIKVHSDTHAHALSSPQTADEVHASDAADLAPQLHVESLRIVSAGMREALLEAVRQLVLARTTEVDHT
ncbi:MAG TPA: hypothetical protein VGO62_07925 [Myxococcota bacterium]|jgi:hypothetical protein